MGHQRAIARRLQLIRVSADRFVLKRGLRELSLGGATAAAIAEPLMALLEGERDREEILAAFSADLRPDVDRLLRALAQRGFLTEPVSAEPEGGLVAAFFDEFGPAGADAPARLAQAEVVVVGVSLIARALCQGLLECGVGRVIVADHPVLTDHLAPAAWSRPEADAGGRLSYCDAMPDDGLLRRASLVCATSDLGEVDALLELNRLAIRFERPFLPAWMHRMSGAVGPLCYPRETACLRCYRLRADSNDPRHELSRAVRHRLSIDAEARAGVGLLSPMPDVVGRIAAMEAAKALGGFVPADAIGRVLEINLIAFGASARRVLKIPRCPDCSERSRRAPIALTHGPQIPDRR